MLFRKKIERSCTYCTYGTRLEEDQILCVKKDPAAILKALKRSNAVLVPGLGAVCSAKDADDLEAIATIMRKSAKTALYAATCNAKHLNPVDRRIMRLVYTMKYAKKKAE